MTYRPHWSYSAISQYLRCPLQYYFQRILGLPAKSVSSGLVLGSAVHSALANFHRHVQQGESPSSASVADSFRGAWQDRESVEAIAYRDGDSRESCIDQGVNLLETYLKEPPPQTIVAIEQQFQIPLYNSHGEYLEKPLVAVTDLLTADAGRVLKVNEFKTSGRAYSESEIQTSLQPTCYAHAINESYGQQPVIEYVVLVKTKTPKVQRLSTARYAEDFGRLGDLVQAVDRAIEVGVFYPIESPMNCATCPFRSPCREWGVAGRNRTEHLDEFAEELACSPS